ncbi:hypothetical protein [Paenibacillus sp. CAA11]|uniref:hypothetical protein n=1 Tax=Paenibacillus sp. CAA11 TaxID=1532905 RepID=UPI00131EFCD8|nr:hypothetical protein [Paenibacillus sp. CAA11]
MMNSTTTVAVTLPLLYMLGYFAIIGVGIYALILFIKLARRGIRALDMYIAEKEDGQSV